MTTQVIFLLAILKVSWGFIDLDFRNMHGRPCSILSRKTTSPKILILSNILLYVDRTIQGITILNSIYSKKKKVLEQYMLTYLWVLVSQFLCLFSFILLYFCSSSVICFFPPPLPPPLAISYFFLCYLF